MKKNTLYQQQQIILPSTTVIVPATSGMNLRAPEYIRKVRLLNTQPLFLLYIRSTRNAYTNLICLEQLLWLRKADTYVRKRMLSRVSQQTVTRKESKDLRTWEFEGWVVGHLYYISSSCLRN